MTARLLESLVYREEGDKVPKEKEIYPLIMKTYMSLGRFYEYATDTAGYCYSARIFEEYVDRTGHAPYAQESTTTPPVPIQDFIRLAQTKGIAFISLRVNGNNSSETNKDCLAIVGEDYVLYELFVSPDKHEEAKTIIEGT